MPTPASPPPVNHPNVNDQGALPAASLLDQAAERADQGRYEEAVALCEQAIRKAGPSARAYFLLGMVRQAAGDRTSAEASFQKRSISTRSMTKRCWPSPSSPSDAVMRHPHWVIVAGPIATPGT